MPCQEPPEVLWVCRNVASDIVPETKCRVDTIASRDKRTIKAHCDSVDCNVTGDCPGPVAYVPRD